MSFDKVVDSGQLDSWLSNIGESVRRKTGKQEKIPIQNIAAEIDSITGGGGTVAVKTGTITLSGYSRVDVEHGCGKLPLAVWTDCPPDIKNQGQNNIVGFFWLRNSLCGTITTNINSHPNAGYPYIQWEKELSSYTVKIDESKIYLNPAQQWVRATYTWHAAYEV